MDLIEPAPAGDERTLLEQFLDFQRAVMVRKVEGLTKEQMATRVGASELTLAGLIKHLALVEDDWFQHDLHDRPNPEPWASAPWDEDRDWEFHSAVDDSPEELIELYLAACERSRAAVAEVDDLETLMARVPKFRERFSLRWILIHMIEETARHLGHADMLRETIDGATGD
jgi:uncharacterized damage-inducible protein DinB